MFPEALNAAGSKAEEEEEEEEDVDEADEEKASCLGGGAGTNVYCECEFAGRGGGGGDPPGKLVVGATLGAGCFVLPPTGGGGAVKENAGGATLGFSSFGGGGKTGGGGKKEGAGVGIEAKEGKPLLLLAVVDAEAVADGNLGAEKFAAAGAAEEDAAAGCGLKGVQKEGGSGIFEGC